MFASVNQLYGDWCFIACFPGASYQRRLRLLLLCLRDVFRALNNSFVCRLCSGAPSLVLFTILRYAIHLFKFDKVPCLLILAFIVCSMYSCCCRVFSCRWRLVCRLWTVEDCCWWAVSIAAMQCSSSWLLRRTVSRVFCWAARSAWWSWRVAACCSIFESWASRRAWRVWIVAACFWSSVSKAATLFASSDLLPSCAARTVVHKNARRSRLRILLRWSGSAR